MANTQAVAAESNAVSAIMAAVDSGHGTGRCDKQALSDGCGRSTGPGWLADGRCSRSIPKDVADWMDTGSIKNPRVEPASFPQVTKVPISHIMSSNPLHIALLTNGFRLHHHTRCPDLTDSAPFQRPPMLEGQYLGSDLEISVVVQQCHIMGVGKGGDQ